MTPIPAGTEPARPFLPTQDFELSKRLYETLGFEKGLDGDVAIFRVGTGGFILQTQMGEIPKKPSNLHIFGQSYWPRFHDKSYRT